MAEREQPRPGAHEVIVKFHAASLNYRDLLFAKGLYNPKARLPAVPLSDGAGEVGVEHEVADDALGIDPVVVGPQVGLVGRAAPQQARPVHQPQCRLGERAVPAQARELDVQDPADLVDPLEVLHRAERGGGRTT